MPTVFGDITPTQAAYSAKTLLERATPFMVLEQLGQLKPLPANSTKTIDFRRYTLPIPTDTTGNVLAEGVTPSEKVVTMTPYTLTLSQYGAILATSDVVDDTHIDDVLGEYFGLLGENAGQIIELMRWEAIRTGAGVNTILTGAVSAENLITTAVGKTELRQAIRSIRAQHARPYTKVVKADVRYGTQAIEPSFVAVMHSDLEGTIREQLGSAFTPVADYGSTASVLQGEFGNFENVRFITSSLIGKRANAGIAVGSAATLLSDNAANVNLYDICLMAADAWVGVALKGEFAVTPSMVKAKPSESDPLGQRSKCGYKTMQAAKVVQPAHIKKIVTGVLKAN